MGLSRCLRDVRTTTKAYLANFRQILKNSCLNTTIKTVNVSSFTYKVENLSFATYYECCRLLMLRI